MLVSARHGSHQISQLPISQGCCGAQLRKHQVHTRGAQVTNFLPFQPFLYLPLFFAVLAGPWREGLLHIYGHKLVVWHFPRWSVLLSINFSKEAMDRILQILKGSTYATGLSADSAFYSCFYLCAPITCLKRSQEVPPSNI